ncbi:ABC transporter permease [Microbacterium tumbae]
MSEIAALERIDGARAARWWAARLREGLMIAPSIAMLVLALLPWNLLPFAPERVAGAPSIPPGSQFWFGTDSAGLDVFSRTVAAARIDLGVGIMSSTFVVIIAGVVGAILGFYEHRRRTAGVLARGALRLVDLLQSVPLTVAALVIVVIFGTDPLVLSWGIAVILSPAQARLVRTEVLRVRREGYIDAARMAGRSEANIAMTRVLPGSLWPLLENWPMLFANAIMIIAALGFLGVGIQPPRAEWGAMISSGTADASAGRWWSVVFPSAALIVSVVAMNLLRRLVVSRLPAHLRRL